MKQLFLLTLMAFAAMSFNSCSEDEGAGDENWTDDSPIIQFKDSNFLAALLKKNIDKNGDQQISQKEAQQVTQMYVFPNISDMDGIQYFTALTSLNCGSNELTSLDVSKNAALTSLECHRNQLTSLDVSKNTALTYLNCSYNQLTSVDVSNNTALTYLDINYNQPPSLDLSKNTALTTLFCQYS